MAHKVSCVGGIKFSCLFNMVFSQNTANNDDDNNTLYHGVYFKQQRSHREFIHTNRQAHWYGHDIKLSDLLDTVAYSRHRSILLTPWWTLDLESWIQLNDQRITTHDCYVQTTRLSIRPFVRPLSPLLLLLSMLYISDCQANELQIKWPNK